MNAPRISALDADDRHRATVSGDRGLALEEPLIFELAQPGTTGVDFDGPIPAPDPALARYLRSEPAALPGLSEPQVVRHYTRLSRQNYAIDLGPFPLGSCTMKHNPRADERVARLAGFADIHPLQPKSTVPGALEAIAQLADWLIALTGMNAVAMSPKAGAHGELCGLLSIRAAIEARGEKRSLVLVPESAHGTNPATAAVAGYAVEAIPATLDGRVDVAALKARLGPDVAAVMITNPNTCGLFERDLKVIADAVHEVGAFVYCDGANFNAIVGHVRPGDLGVDAMHINLHKTFATPHGGGGPGAGPVVLSQALAPFAPLPFITRDEQGVIRLIEEEEAPEDHPQSFGRMAAFHGQMGMFTRALAYILAHGSDGLRQVSGDAVLAANYVLRSLDGVLDAPFGSFGPCCHEALFSDKGLAEGFSTLDIAKGLIDEGFHPMTVFFPLVVHGAMLIEPTECESKADLDRFIASLAHVTERARAGDETLKTAPHFAPRRRLDEVLAARRPKLVA